MAPSVPAMKYVGEDHGGAMTDATKRRFLDDVVDEDASFAEFEVVQAINDFNGGFSAVDLPCLDLAMQAWVLLPLVMATAALATSQMASTTMTAGMAVLPGNAPLAPPTKTQCKGRRQSLLRKTLHGTLRSMKRSKTL